MVTCWALTCWIGQVLVSIKFYIEDLLIITRRNQLLILLGSSDYEQSIVGFVVNMSGEHDECVIVQLNEDEQDQFVSQEGNYN